MSSYPDTHSSSSLSRLPLSVLMDVNSGISLATAERRLSLASYYSVGSLSVLIWDILYNLANDYDLIKSHGLDLVLIAYLVSRASTVCFVTITTTMLTATLNDCQSYRASASAFFILFTTSTLFLSYIRVCAVWNRSWTVVIAFGILWLASLASSLTTIGGLKILRLEQLCLPETAGDFVAAAVLVPTFNHIFVFSTITYGLCRTRSQPSLLDFRKGYKLYILGDTLPDFSKALLQSSQLCYLVVVMMGILTVGWFFGYGSDQAYRIAIYPPYATIVNIMFSWVFRKAKLGVFTIISPTSDTSNAMGLRRIRNASVSVLKPAAVFMSKKDVESKNEELQIRRDPSLQGYNYDNDQKQFKYNIQGGLNTSSPVRIGVEQVVELVSDMSDGAGKRASGSSQFSV